MPILGNGNEAPVPLSEAPLGSACRIVCLVAAGFSRRRLLDVGFVPGACVAPVRRSPAGDPTAYCVKGALIAVRAQEAKEIMVHILPPGLPASGRVVWNDSRTPAVAPGPDFDAGLDPGSGTASLTEVSPVRFMHHPSLRVSCGVRKPRPGRSQGAPPPVCRTVALAGNPNTGKSTVFNALTGLDQHTGNWPGKTVVVAEGFYTHRGTTYRVVDLPGTYSLLATSPEEEVARDFICFGGADATAVVADATCLERNLNLVLQIMEIRPRVVVCLNLMDEARRKGISLDAKGLASELGVPVVPTVARARQGLAALMDAIADVASGQLPTRPLEVTYSPEIEALVGDIERPLAAIMGEIAPGISLRWLALRLIDDDRGLIEAINERVSKKRAQDTRSRRAARPVAARSGIPA
ncbi:MAG: FeoB small GTPase domain-containing protein [Bacillota bacterium]